MPETTTTTSNTNSSRILQVIPQHASLIQQEESIAKTPYSVTAWMTYLDEVDTLLANQKKDASTKMTTVFNDIILLRDLTGRRAVHHLPKSYKLWKSHWEFVLQYSTIIGPEKVSQLWERALVTLHKFPRVWVEYLQYAHSTMTTTTSTSTTTTTPEPTLTPLFSSTQLRRLANRALESLPVTQHDKIWPILLKYYQTSEAEMPYIPKESKLCLLRRYIQFNPVATHEVANFLVDSLGQWGEAALLYVKLLNDPTTTSPLQRKELWMSLAKICTRHPCHTIGLDWDAMVRAVLVRNNKQQNMSFFLPKEMHGILWNQLADSWIRRGEFQLARSVYEEAIESVMTVRDFTILLDAYLQFEEGLLEATMEAQQEGEGEEEDNMEEEAGGAETADDDDWDLLVPQTKSISTSSNDQTTTTTKTTMADLELALARAEDLTARRPLLLNRVLLRQNPHDVGEWLKRARLYQEQEQVAQAAAALEEGLQTVHARRAFGGSPSQMVLELVKIYEMELKDVAKARDLLDRICNRWEYEFKTTDDLAECHAAWAELELRQEAWDSALDIIRQSVAVVDFKSAPKMAKGLCKSLRLWDLVLDLEESLGTVQSTKDAYNRAIEQRVATPLHILNFATFLTEQKYFEEAFSAYERGIELFDFPGVKVIWKAFLDAFLKRYGGTKVERTRDLFQRCNEACPPEECAEFYLMNGKFEEEHGLTKRALGIYKEMCQKVPPAEKYTAYQLFIAKTTKYLGKTATRDIYQSAIEDVEDNFAAQLCQDFAKMETSLQEIDRARAVLTYGAQTADPRRNEEYWRTWNEFEVAHGNEETFREMLRIKRSVEASFSTVNYNAAEMSSTAAKGDTLSNEEAMQMIAEREGVELETTATAAAVNKPIQGFVPATKRTADVANLDDVEERVAKLRKATAAEADKPATNDDADEIDIDDLDDEDDDDEEEGDQEDQQASKPVQDVSTKSVPAAVFGGLAKLVDEEQEAPKGALERLRAAKSKD